MIEYLAGIFDAEGYVRIRRTMSSSKTKNLCYTPEVKIYMCEEAIIQKFADIYNLEVKQDNRGKYRKIAYHVSLGVKKLRETTFILDFLPLIQEKKLQLQEVANLLEGIKSKEDCYQDYMLAKKSFMHPIIDELSDEYIAGIIDGDGWFSMFNAGKGKSMYNKFSVGLQQRYKPMVEYMTKFGGSNVHKCKLYDNQNHIQTYSWNCTTYNILPLLRKIRPYLIEKENKCKLLINYIEEYEKFRKYSAEVLKTW